MPLQPNQTLLHYQLTEKLGEGGMGVVWRARDTHLDREVAIKVLPPTMAEDRERIARFQREAKLLASVNHPNIAAVHGFDTVDDLRFLVMEYVEGETLADRLDRGPLQVDDALAVARQIAEALEVAHGSGVIHRDLKPGNVMLRPDGTVKVLDFGLAKELPTTSATDGSLSPTFTAEFTTPGVVLGTAAYMSPEQARGRAVDKRTDIWAFGVILFECLTGGRLFAGDSAHDSMGAILHKEPEWSRLPAGTPPTIQLLLRRCLAKQRKRRLHDIADARVEIEAAIDDPSGSSLGLAAEALVEAEPASSRRGGLVGLAAGLLLGALAVGGFFTFRTPPVEPEPVRRFEFAQDLKPRGPVISKDGRSIAFVSESTVYVRDLDSVEARPLWTAPEDQGIRGLLWSPDATALAFYSKQTLWRVAVASGQAIELLEKPALFPLDWTEDGTIWLHGFGDGVTYRVPARGGAAEPVFERAEGEVHLHGFSALPEKRGFIAASHATAFDGDVLVLLTTDGKRRTLHEWDRNVGGLRYASTGHIVYGQDSHPKGIWALPFSLDDLKVTGEPFLVHADIGEFSVSDTGDLVYSNHDPASGRESRLVWVTRAGEVESEIGVTLYNAFGGMALSNDGRRLAVSARGLDDSESETDSDIWIVDLDRALATRLATEKGFQVDPGWSLNDERIVYVSGSLANFHVVARAADGSGTAETLVENGFGISTADGGTTTAIQRGSVTTDIWIEVGRLDDPSTWREFQNGDESDFAAQVRPGGGLIVYLSGPVMSNEQTLFLRRFPEGGGRWQVSRKTDGSVRWSRTGDRLYFVEKDGTERTLKEMRVEIDGDNVRLGNATPLFSMSDNRFFGFDVAPDGERFLVLQGPEENEDDEPAAEGVVVVENWFEEFRDGS